MFISVKLPFSLLLFLFTLSRFADATELSTQIGITMVNIPAGNFAMGTCKYPLNATCLVGNSDMDAFNDQTPQHAVNVRAFQLSKTEITLKQFKHFVAATGRGHLLTPLFKEFNRYGEDAPVVMVSWHDAQDFVTWLNSQSKGGYRLPSEAEWEYACRAGSYHSHCGADNAGYAAWYSGNSDNHQQPVGKKQPNAWGLYDMSGNVWEWVQDCWHEDYRNAPAQSDAWSRLCRSGSHVRRGGSWYDYAEYALAVYRSYDTPATRNNALGFRIARNLP